MYVNARGRVGVGAGVNIPRYLPNSLKPLPHPPSFPLFILCERRDVSSQVRMDDMTEICANNHNLHAEEVSVQ